MIVPAPITTLPNTGTTREQRRQHYIAVLEEAIEEAVNDQIWLEDDENERGKFQYVASTQIDVVLDDEALLGWYADGQPSIFTGTYEEDGHRFPWSAEVRWRKGKRLARRNRRVLTLRLFVEPR